MKKRLRKKYRLREFKEFGFQVGFKFKNTGEEIRESLLCDFAAYLDSKGLVCGGSSVEDEFDLLVTAKKGSATEEHRGAVIQWLTGNDKVSAYAVTPLIDAWNDPLKDLTPDYQAK